jgi:hypothetical protein
MHPKLLGLVLQLDLLGYTSLVLLLILLLGWTLQPNPRFLDIALQKDLTLLDFSFFFVFFRQKKINL